MKQYILFIGAACSLSAFASNPPAKVVVGVNAEQVGKKVCYYHDKAYSKGAVLQIGEHYIICQSEHQFESNGALSWRRLNDEERDVQSTIETKGMDLKVQLQELVTKHDIKAGSIASCVGCLSQLHIRLAGATSTLILEEPLEIVSLMGTLTPDHQHVHISVAKQSGEVIGGHLMEGCTIDTTAELIVHKYGSLQFARELDPSTGYSELVVSEGEA